MESKTKDVLIEYEVGIDKLMKQSIDMIASAAAGTTEQLKKKLELNFKNKKDVYA